MTYYRVKVGIIKKYIQITSVKYQKKKNLNQEVPFVKVRSLNIELPVEDEGKADFLLMT